MGERRASSAMDNLSDYASGLTPGWLNVHFGNL